MNHTTQNCCHSGHIRRGLSRIFVRRRVQKRGSRSDWLVFGPRLMASRFCSSGVLSRAVNSTFASCPATASSLRCVFWASVRVCRNWSTVHLFTACPDCERAATMASNVSQFRIPFCMVKSPFHSHRNCTSGAITQTTCILERWQAISSPRILSAGLSSVRD
jgi:hypothetical protein